MKQNLFFIFALFFLQGINSDGQALDLYVVNIKGKVTSSDNGEPIPYARVINPKVHGGTTTNADGFFAIQLLTEDTLTISAMGYVDEKFFVTEFPPKQLYVVVMKPVKYELNEVTVRPNPNLRNMLGMPDFEPLTIPIELRGDAFNEKPPWFTALLNPISFMQYHLSEKEKVKRETLKVIKNNEEWVLFSSYHNIENIKRLTGLTDEEADRFMMYCNIHNRLPFFSSQMEIEFQIMDFYFKYKKEKEAEKSAPKTE